MAKDTMFASHVNSTEADIIFLLIFEMKDLRALSQNLPDSMVEG